MTQMQVETLRKGSQGIQGTFANIRHHARSLESLVERIVTLVDLNKKELKFARWRQGNNVHLFETQDGRTFVFRHLRLTGKGYCGLTLALRVAYGQEVHLMTIYTDTHNHLTPEGLVSALCWMSDVKPVGGEAYVEH
jgi:hypothetical protein